MGNEKSNSYWEAELPPNYVRVGHASDNKIIHPPNRNGSIHLPNTNNSVQNLHPPTNGSIPASKSSIHVASKVSEQVVSCSLFLLCADLFFPCLLLLSIHYILVTFYCI